MFDLDSAEKIPDYRLKFKGEEHAYDSVLIIKEFAKQLQGEIDPEQLRIKVSAIFSLTFTTCEALLVLRDFEKFADGFEETVKNVFGRSQSSSTTTDSDQENASGSPTTSDSD